jgi:hypothetical protein
LQTRHCFFWRRATRRVPDRAVSRAAHYSGRNRENALRAVAGLWRSGGFDSFTYRMAATLMTNLIALGSVLLGIATLATRLGPRTASNDLYHRIMLILIGASLLILFFRRSALRNLK